VNLLATDKQNLSYINRSRQVVRYFLKIDYSFLFAISSCSKDVKSIHEEGNIYQLNENYGSFSFMLLGMFGKRYSPNKNLVQHRELTKAVFTGINLILVVRLRFLMETEGLQVLESSLHLSDFYQISRTKVSETHLFNF
jgi:hypothetical protein